MEVAIYNPNSAHAGSRCWPNERRNDPSGYPTGDVTIYKGGDDTLREEINRLVAMSKQVTAGADWFFRRSARTLAIAIGDPDPFGDA